MGVMGGEIQLTSALLLNNNFKVKVYLLSKFPETCVILSLISRTYILLSQYCPLKNFVMPLVHPPFQILHLPLHSFTVYKIERLINSVRFIYTCSPRMTWSSCLVYFH